MVHAISSHLFKCLTLIFRLNDINNSSTLNRSNLLTYDRCTNEHVRLIPLQWIDQNISQVHTGTLWVADKECYSCLSLFVRPGMPGALPVQGQPQYQQPGQPAPAAIPQPPPPQGQYMAPPGGQYQAPPQSNAMPPGAPPAGQLPPQAQPEAQLISFDW